MANVGHFYLILVVLLQYIVIGQQLQCPLVCECYYESEKLKVSCPNRCLIELPEDISEDIEILDLSNNELQEFPSFERLHFLTELDLSGNLIKTIPENALSNLSRLEILNLAANGFNSWLNIHPNTLLLPTVNIKHLDLSENDWRVFGDLKDSEILVSPSLQVLVLKLSNINSVHANSPIRGLSSLKTLDLTQNPLQRIRKLMSETLEELNLSNCDLSYIYHTELHFLPALRTLNLAHNYRLKITSDIGNLYSNSLRELDISYCNIAQPGIGGFPNLKFVSLRGNMIRELGSRQFLNNSRIEELDISSNSIGNINVHAFYGMTELQKLNLSMNYISNIPENTFRATPQLKTLLLFRNYLSSVIKLNAFNLEHLDMSLCEIIDFEASHLARLTALVQLNLSRNLIMYMPTNLQLLQLKLLDISYNRLTSVQNDTFTGMPNLVVLRMQSNRFSTIWKRELFAANPMLREVKIGDNPWRCDCDDENMKDFYEFLTDEPTKVKSIHLLNCETPEEYSGYTWTDICLHIWYPSIYNSEEVKENERVTWFIIIMFITFGVCMFILWVIRKAMNAKLENMRLERVHQAAEARERLRLIRLQREQEAQTNAPDPRDLISPPSYDEALTMPRLDGSFHSLASLGTGGSKPKRKRRRRTKSSGDLLDTNTQTEDIHVNGDANPHMLRLSREIAQLDQSPRARRRSLHDDNREVIQIDVDIERGPRSRGGSQQVLRESDF